MPDQPADRLTFAPQPDTLESRLDALGRSLVEEEARRAQPPGAFLEAAAGRAMFSRIRVWTPRMAIAAAVLLAGIAVYLFSRPAPVPSSGGSVPIAIDTPGAESSAPAPTVANLQTANRSVASPEQLQLLSGGAAAPPGDAAPTPYRASDTRDPARIDAIVGDR